MNSFENFSANTPTTPENEKQEKPPVVVDKDITTKRFSPSPATSDKDLLGGITLEKDKELPIEIPRNVFSMLNLDQVERELKSIGYVIQTFQKEDLLKPEVYKKMQQYEMAKLRYTQLTGKEWTPSQVSDEEAMRGFREAA